MTELTDLSETDDSNTSITTINIAEGCAPSNINNGMRATLGLIRRAFKSSIFRLRDSTDQTKLLALNLSGITTATTRTITVPDADITLPIVTPWVEYTPTFVGMASPTQLKVLSRRNGPDLEVIARWQNGTVSGSTFTMTLGYNGSSGGVTISSDWTGLNFVAGPAIWSANDFALCILAVGGEGVVRIGASGSGVNSFAPLTGSGLQASTVLSAKYSVPIQGW